MKTTVNAKLFKDALATVLTAIASKNALAVFENVRIETDGSKMILRGGGSDISMSRTIETAQGEGNEVYLVNAFELNRILSTIPDVPLELDRDGMMLTLRFDLAEFEIPCMDANEYPLMPEIEGDEITLLPESVRMANETVAYAVSTEPIRPMMTGVFVEIKPETVTFVATDTHKMAVLEVAFESGVEQSVIIPGGFFNKITKLIPKGSDVALTLKTDGNRISVKTDNGTLDGVAIKGNYPNFRRVMPDYTQGHMKLTAEKGDFTSSLTRANTAKSMASNLVRMELSPDGCSLVGQEIERGRKTKSKLPCEYDGHDFTIGINGDYAKEIVRACPTNKIEAYVCDPARPIVFVPENNPQGMSLTTILMPLQLIES